MRSCSTSSHAHTRKFEVYLILKMTIFSLSIPLPLDRLVTNHPQRQHEADRASSHSDNVRRAVALKTLHARAFASRAHDAVLVENDTIKQIEDVARENGGHGHEAPVLGQSVNAEAFGHDGGKYAKEEAVA